METAKYTSLAGAARGKNPYRRTPVVVGFLALISTAVYLLAPSSPPTRSPASAGNTYPIQLLPEACELRFWKRRALPYCERATPASWIESTAEKQPLDVFQVHTPPRVGGEYLAGTTGKQPELATTAAGSGKTEGECSQVLMQHVFGWSYGKPFVGEYNPPIECGWTHVLFNLTMTSRGRQYDRLGHLFLGDIEVWRTSTAEPTSNGIVFSYVKDMTHLTALLQKPQKLIFDLGNLVNDVYTGSFNATLTATFYSPLQISPPNPADLILPISAQKSARGEPSHFHLPSERATASLDIPKNSIRAVVSVSASGNADEEFWYTNVPSEYSHTFEGSVLPGYSPFREIQVLVDGEPAGFVWPFATIFTGGIVPSLWRPIVSPTAFDLPEYEIDITPFIPVILEGKSTIEFVIYTYDSSKGVLTKKLGNNWLLSGRVHIWTDADPEWTTTGTLHQHLISPPLFSFEPILELDDNGANKSLSTTLVASRNLVAISTLSTSTGDITATWIQGLHHDSFITIRDGGNTQLLSTSTAGTETTVSHGSRSYRYHPLRLNTSFIPHQDSFELTADLQIGLSVGGAGKWSDGVKIASAGKLGTQLKGQAEWASNQGGSGVTTQVWAEVRPLRDVESVASYGRRVTAAGGEVRQDWERINGVGEGWVDMQTVLEGLVDGLD